MLLRWCQCLTSSTAARTVSRRASDLRDNHATRRRLLRALLRVGIILVYIGVGIAVFVNAEVKPCESASAIASHNGSDECVEALSVVDALYFSTVTMSTVGYGTRDEIRTRNSCFAHHQQPVCSCRSCMFQRLSLSPRRLLAIISRDPSVHNPLHPRRLQLRVCAALPSLRLPSGTLPPGVLGVCGPL